VLSGRKCTAVTACAAKDLLEHRRRSSVHEVNTSINSSEGFHMFTSLGKWFTIYKLLRFSRVQNNKTRI
jgi:hypothetical protein